MERKLVDGHGQQMQPINVYAEVLSFVGSVSVIVTLSSVAEADTAVKIEDGIKLLITHRGSSLQLKLPGQVVVEGELPVQPTASVLSFRLKLKDASFSLRGRNVPNYIPWMAHELATVSEFCCRKCSQTIMVNGKFKSWENLPNENWAEMMDLWHCHKPSESHSKGPDAQIKGYSASNQLVAKSGVCLVENVYFLLDELDCEGVKIINSDPDWNLVCRSCGACLGSSDSPKRGWRIYKWSLKVRTTASSKDYKVFPIECYFCALLLAHVENYGVQKFIIRAGTSRPVYKLDLFNPELCYSDTMTPDSPQLALKVLFNVIGDSANSVNEFLPSEEVIRLPYEIIDHIIGLLEDRNKQLPLTVQKIQDRPVSLLHRFSPPALYANEYEYP